MSPEPKEAGREPSASYALPSVLEWIRHPGVYVSMQEKGKQHSLDIKDALAVAVDGLLAENREAVSLLRECMGHMPVVPAGLPEYEQRWGHVAAFRRAHAFLETIPHAH